MRKPLPENQKPHPEQDGAFDWLLEDMAQTMPSIGFSNFA